MFTREILQSLRDQGIVSIKDGRCVVNSEQGKVRRISLPNTVEGALGLAIGNLNPEQMLVLKVISVFRRAATEASIISLCRDVMKKKSKVLQHLQYLTEHVYLDAVQEGGGGAWTYSFRNASLRAHVYNMLKFRRKEQLHTKAATLIEGMWAGFDNTKMVQETNAMLGHHWSRAAEEERYRAIPYLIDCASFAQSSYQHNSVVHYLEEATKLYRSLDDKGRELCAIDPKKYVNMCQTLGSAYLSIDELDLASNTFSECLLVIGEAVPGEGEIWAANAYLQLRSALLGSGCTLPCIPTNKMLMQG